MEERDGDPVELRDAVRQGVALWEVVCCLTGLPEGEPLSTPLTLALELCEGEPVLSASVPVGVGLPVPAAEALAVGVEEWEGLLEGALCVALLQALKDLVPEGVREGEVLVVCEGEAGGVTLPLALPLALGLWVVEGEWEGEALRVGTHTVALGLCDRLGVGERLRVAVEQLLAAPPLKALLGVRVGEGVAA